MRLKRKFVYVCLVLMLGLSIVEGGLVKVKKVGASPSLIFTKPDSTHYTLQNGEWQFNLEKHATQGWIFTSEGVRIWGDGAWQEIFDSYYGSDGADTTPLEIMAIYKDAAEFNVYPIYDSVVKNSSTEKQLKVWGSTATGGKNYTWYWNIYANETHVKYMHQININASTTFNHYNDGAYLSIDVTNNYGDDVQEGITWFPYGQICRGEPPMLSKRFYLAEIVLNQTGVTGFFSGVDQFGRITSVSPPLYTTTGRTSFYFETHLLAQWDGEYLTFVNKVNNFLIGNLKPPDAYEIRSTSDTVPNYVNKLLTIQNWQDLTSWKGGYGLGAPYPPYEIYQSLCGTPEIGRALLRYYKLSGNTTILNRCKKIGNLLVENAKNSTYGFFYESLDANGNPMKDWNNQDYLWMHTQSETTLFLLELYEQTADVSYKNTAKSAVDFWLTKQGADGSWFIKYKSLSLTAPTSIEDYKHVASSLFASALVKAYEIIGNSTYLAKAEKAINYFYNKVKNGRHISQIFWFNFYLDDEVGYDVLYQESMISATYPIIALCDLYETTKNSTYKIWAENLFPLISLWVYKTNGIHTSDMKLSYTIHESQAFPAYIETLPEFNLAVIKLYKATLNQSYMDYAIQLHRATRQLKWRLADPTEFDLWHDYYNKYKNEYKNDNQITLAAKFIDIACQMRMLFGDVYLGTSQFKIDSSTSVFGDGGGIFAYTTDFNHEITSASYVNEKLSLTISGKTGTTSTTKVYVGDKGKPVSVILPDSWGYDETTKIVTITKTYASETTTILDWNIQGATSTTRRVPTEYPTIQAAINAASPGDTVSVAPGVYLEHVVVNKTVNLIGDNKETTIIDGKGTGPVVHVTAASVNISGFTIQNASEVGIGVSVEGTTGSNVIGNIMRNNWMGISLKTSSGNTVQDNLVANNTYGIYLSQSGHNNFIHNTAMDNRFGFVISLSGSGGNVLRNNSMSRNSLNLKLFVTSVLSDLVQDIDPSNTVDGKSIYYWVNQRDKQVPSNAGYVAIINSTNITVKDSVLAKNGEGVLLVYTRTSTIENVTASDLLGDGVVLLRSDGNRVFSSTMNNNIRGVLIDRSNDNIVLANTVANNSNGIELEEGTNNIIYGNNVTDSRTAGIFLFSSNNNTIHHNSFIDNTLQVFDMHWDDPSVPSSINTWDEGYPHGGNFWSDYSGTDIYSGPYQNQTGSDGIGDSPYIIDDSNQDRYPLVPSVPPVIPPPPAPDFILSAAPLSQTVGTGQSVNYTLTVVSVYGFNSEVHLNATINPFSSDISLTISLKSVIPPANGSVQSILTVSVNSEATPTTYTITLNATDNTGDFATDIVKLVVADVIKPRADAGPDQTVDEDTLVTFDGSGSDDNIGVENYTWTFIDVELQILTDVNPTYVFDTPGRYVVTLNVTDAAGNWDIDGVAVTVLDVTKPHADAGQDQTVSLGTSVTFDGGDSTDNVGIASYKWDFGDGSNGTGVRVTHTYSKAGTYNVTLTVKDEAGNSGTDWVIITVTAIPETGILSLVLVAGGVTAIVGLALGALFWRRRKQLTRKPVQS